MKGVIIAGDKAYPYRSAQRMPVHVHGAAIGLPQIIRREDFCRRTDGQPPPFFNQQEPAGEHGRQTEIGAQGHDPFKVRINVTADPGQRRRGPGSAGDVSGRRRKNRTTQARSDMLFMVIYAK